MKRLKFRSFHAHEFANANKITQLIRRNSLGRDEISSIRGIVRVSPLIYHIDKGKTAGGAAEESSFVETFVYTRLCMCVRLTCVLRMQLIFIWGRKRKCLFSHPHLSPALLNYVCRIRTYPHRPPRICCSNISQWYNRLFIASLFSNPV